MYVYVYVCILRWHELCMNCVLHDIVSCWLLHAGLLQEEYLRNTFNARTLHE